jgi:hypothetical protein
VQKIYSQIQTKSNEESFSELSQAIHPDENLWLNFNLIENVYLFQKYFCFIQQITRFQFEQFQKILILFQGIQSIPINQSNVQFYQQEFTQDKDQLLFNSQHFHGNSSKNKHLCHLIPLQYGGTNRIYNSVLLTKSEMHQIQSFVQDSFLSLQIGNKFNNLITNYDDKFIKIDMQCFNNFPLFYEYRIFIIQIKNRHFQSKQNMISQMKEVFHHYTYEQFYVISISKRKQNRNNFNSLRSNLCQSLEADFNYYCQGEQPSYYSNFYEWTKSNLEFNSSFSIPT